MPVSKAKSWLLKMFEFGIDDTPSVAQDENTILEDKFQNDNFELITWFVLS